MSNIVERLIIGNNVYDINDDELESEANTFYSQLYAKELEARLGKQAIITATQNKTGKTIVTNTYDEICDKIDDMTVTTLNIDNFNICAIYSSYPNLTYNQLIEDGEKVRMSNWLSLLTEGNCAFHMDVPRTVLHRPGGTGIDYKLEVQCNLDFAGTAADNTPLITIFGGQYNDLMACISKTSETELYLKCATYVGSYAEDDKTTPSMISYKFFEISIEHLSGTAVDLFKISIYGGNRVQDDTISGYKPNSKNLLMRITNYVSDQIKNFLVSDDALSFELCGCSSMDLRGHNRGQTQAYIHDFGIKLTSPTRVDSIGNTNFIDMEETS